MKEPKRREERIELRVSAEEKQLFAAAATRAQRSLSDWMRVVAIREAMVRDEEEV